MNTTTAAHPSAALTHKQRSMLLTILAFIFFALLPKFWTDDGDLDSLANAMSPACSTSATPPSLPSALTTTAFSPASR